MLLRWARPLRCQEQAWRRVKLKGWAKFLKGKLGELKDLRGDAKEEIAYLLGMECYVYGFPLVLMDVTNGVVTATSKSEEYKAPFNQFGRMRGYVNPDFKDVVRISVSTVWSFAILDLDKEPMIASHPDTKGRYRRA